MNDFIDRFNSFPLAQTVLALILMMIAFVLIFWFSFLEPVQTKIKSAENQLQQLQREKERLDQLKRNRAVVLAQLEKLKRQLLIAQEKLPQDAEIPSLLQRIHNQAKTAGLEITVFKRQPDTNKQYYVEIPVDMNLRGTYDELANFLYYVGRMTRIVNVRNLTMSRQASGLVPDGELAVTARATTFRYSTPAPAAAPGQPQ